MSKRFFHAAFLCLFLLSFPPPASAWTFTLRHPWGISFQTLTRSESGLVRTLAELNAAERKRIYRFCKDINIEGDEVRVYFDFVSNRLYQVEYRFKRPGEGVFSKMHKRLSAEFGAPAVTETLPLKVEAPFAAREVRSVIWEGKTHDVQLLSRTNDLKEHDVVRSLSVVFRDARKEAADVQRLLVKDDAALAAEGPRISVSFAGAINLASLSAKGEGDAAWFSFASVGRILGASDLSVGLLAAEGKEGEELSPAELESLAESGMHAVAIACSRPDCLQATRAALRALGIRSFLTGPGKKASNQVAIDIRGVPLLLLGFSQNNGAAPAAVRNGPVSEAARELGKRVETEVAGAKAAGNTVVAVFYWKTDEEVSACLSEEQQFLAQSAQKAGVALVIGYKLPVTQAIHEDGRQVTFFSPGELFPGWHDGKGEKRSLLFTAFLTKIGLVGYDFLPLQVTRQTEGRPLEAALLDAGDKKEFIGNFNGLDATCAGVGLEAVEKGPDNK